MKSSPNQRTHPLSWAWLLAVIVVAILAMACGSTTPPVAQPTPDYHALETRVEAMLRATFTAMAPPATSTPLPTVTAVITPTDLPMAVTATPPVDLIHGAWTLAFVQRGPEGESNIVLDGVAPEDRVTLTRLAGSETITDLTWAPDGQSLLFVSGYNALLSRHNERNLFMVRGDGTGLQMIAGEFLSAEQAPGPYVTLEGRVVGAEGDCLVSAQGVAGPTEVDDSGAFRIPGVPVSATWARAVCAFEGGALAGDVTIIAEGGIFPLTQIVVLAGGQGWRQADLSRDGLRVAGTYYRWGEIADPVATATPAATPETIAADAPTAAPEGDAEATEPARPRYQFWGRIYDLASENEVALEPAQVGDLNGLDWSPVDDRLVGALTSGDGGWIWLWDATGASVGELFKMPNPDDQILTLANPVWSPDGRQVVFEARRWYWWGEDKYRTDLMILGDEGQTIRPLVESAWGEHARNPGWMPDGQAVVYQYTHVAPSQELATAQEGSIWLVEVDGGMRLPWTSGPADLRPAPHPWGITPMPPPVSLSAVN